MKKKSYLNTFAIYLIIVATIALTTGALSIVWLRQQIHGTAKSMLSLEQKLISYNRKNIYYKSKIAEIHNPEYLRKFEGVNIASANKNLIVWIDNAERQRIKPYTVACNFNQHPQTYF